MKVKIRTLSGIVEVVQVKSLDELAREMLQMPYTVYVGYNVLGMICGYDENNNVVTTAEELKDD